MPSILTPQALQTLSRASHTKIVQTFSDLEPHFSLGSWLTSTNRYKDDCVNKLKIDETAGTVNSHDLSQYIAASLPIHCLDGWAFLSKAMTCYVDGCPHQAAHFAYYAELRASMAILAAQGIGVFDKFHYVVEQTGNCSKVEGNLGTHLFSWLALKWWASKSDSGTRLLELFVVANSTFGEWLRGYPGYSVATTLAQQWLGNWGLDLSVVQDDQSVRNVASYRPSTFSPLEVDARHCSQFLQSLWSLFEPSRSSFESLDIHLLNIITSKLFVGNTEARSRWLDTIIDPLTIPTTEKLRLKTRLEGPPGSYILFERMNPGAITPDTHIHERVMARAALLLRVASGFGAQVINDAAFKAADLGFWTDPIGGARGFWPASNVSNDLGELWDQISLARDDELDWIKSKDPAGSIPMFDWKIGREQVLQPLTECDRVGLWGLRR